MKISFSFLLVFAIAAPSVFAGTIAAVPSPKLDALTGGRTTTTTSETKIIATPAVRKSTTRTAPVAAAPSAPTPTSTPAPTPITTAIETPIAATVTTDTKPARIYIGTQLGDSIVGALVGLQINKMYSVEARYDYVDTIYLPTSNTKSSNIGLAGVVLFPLKLSDFKLNDMEPFYVFAKAGYERSTKKITTNDPGIPPFFPATTTVVTTVKSRLLIGGGAQYDFSKKFSGRVGVNFIGSDNSVYLTVIYKL
ncbi:MAG: outer membrane beta-barrel protein [Gallionella sp.]|nr:outer membrane beta-barrel protein [Gallionella sp.]